MFGPADQVRVNRICIRNLAPAEGDRAAWGGEGRGRAVGLWFGPGVAAAIGSRGRLRDVDRRDHLRIIGRRSEGHRVAQRGPLRWLFMPSARAVKQAEPGQRGQQERDLKPEW